jgi:hypothetical protein
MLINVISFKVIKNAHTDIAIEENKREMNKFADGSEHKENAYNDPNQKHARPNATLNQANEDDYQTIEEARPSQTDENSYEMVPKGNVDNIYEAVGAGNK